MRKIKLFIYITTLFITTSVYGNEYQAPSLPELSMPEVSFQLAPAITTPKMEQGRFIASVTPMMEHQLVPGPEEQYKNNDNLIFYSSYELPGQTRSEMEILSYHPSRTPASVEMSYWQMEVWER